MYNEYFSHFTWMLNKDTLLSGLINEFGVYISDDVWDYRREHIVALGKEAYEMALYETDKFIETLKTGVYGDPKSIRYEFYAAYKAFEEKTGLTYDNLDDLISEDTHEEKVRIFKKLKEKHINIIKKRIESKDPKIIANFAYDNFFDYLPKEDLVKVLLDEELYNITIEDFFDFDIFSDRYLSKLGGSISEILRDKIVKSIKENDLEALLNLFGRGVFSNLTEEDFLTILSKSKSNFIEIIMKALQETKKHKYLLEECMIFTYHLREYPIKAIVKQYINSIINEEVKIDWEIFIKSRILEILDNLELISLFENENLKLLEKIDLLADENHFEIGEWFDFKFLEQKKNKTSFSKSFKNLILNILKTNDLHKIASIDNNNWFEFLNMRDFEELFDEYNIIEKILNAFNKLGYEYYGFTINEVIFELISKKIPKQEVNALEDLQKILNKELVYLNRKFLVYNHEDVNGYLLEDNHIIGINLNYNKISELPDSIGNFTHLKYLYLENCQIDKLPNSIGNLELLEVLDLSDNNLKRLPDSFNNLKCIKKINISYNQLGSIPESFKSLNSLKTLMLNYNQFYSLPEFTSKLKKLRYLDLGDDLILGSFPILIEMKRLGWRAGDEELKGRFIEFWVNCAPFMGNLISYEGLLDKFFNRDELLKLVEYKEQKSINSIKKLLQSLKVDKFKMTFGKSLQSTLIEYNQGFKIRGKHIVGLKITGCEFNGKKLKEISNEIKNLEYIEYLNLRQDKLIEIPQFIRNLKNLEVLDLRGNNIKEVPPFLLNLVNLEELNLSGNPLSDQAIDTIRLINLKHFNIIF